MQVIYPRPVLSSLNVRLKKPSWTRGKLERESDKKRRIAKERKKRNQAGEKGEARIGTKGVEESGYIKRISVGFGTNNFEN